MTVDLSLLKDWRQRIEKDIARLEQQMEPLRCAVARKREELAAIDRLMELQGSGPAEPLGENKLVQPSGRPSKPFVDAAQALLAAAGKPMYYKELCRRVMDRGTLVPGRNPPANLIAHLSRDSGFVRVGRGMYGLSEWKLKGSVRARKRRKKRKR